MKEIFVVFALAFALLALGFSLFASPAAVMYPQQVVADGGGGCSGSNC